MAKTEPLHILIHSLSRSEKRYFKLSCTREASGENYLKLFEEIQKQDEYNEAAIKKKFEKEKFVGQLHVTKIYLKKLILKSLRNFHCTISIDAEIKDTLRNVEILYNKELYDICESELKRAERIALDNEINTATIEVKSWIRKLEQIKRPHNYRRFSQLLTEQKTAIELAENTNDYWQLAVRLSGNTFLNNNEVLETPLLKDSSYALSREAKVLFYNLAYLLNIQQNEEAEAESALLSIIHFLEEKPEKLKVEAGMYVSSINNLLSFWVYKKNYEGALELVRKAKEVYKSFSITTENRILLKQILRTFNTELEIYRITKSFSEKEGFIKSTQLFVEENIYKMPREYLISFWFQFANIYFIKKDYKQSLHWTNRLLNGRFKTIRTDLQLQAHMLNLMIHLEQQNLFVLRYYVDSARRYMKKIKEVQPYENILLKFFIKMGNLPLLEYPQAFVTLKNQLWPEGKKPLVPDDVLQSLDYREWIDGKLKGV